MAKNCIITYSPNKQILGEKNYTLEEFKEFVLNNPLLFEDKLKELQKNPIFIKSIEPVHHPENIVEKVHEVKSEENFKEVGIKEGVSELFENNPELANSVYEALGFKQNKITLLDVPENIKELDNPNRTKQVFKFGIKNFGTIEVVLPFNKNEAPNVHWILKTNQNLKQPNVALNAYKELNSYLQSLGFLPLKSDSKNISKGALNIWESLVNSNLAIKIGTSKIGKPIYQFIDNVDNQITPQQKQQAQQLYSQYLDTIFPDSKVKDIVYHNSPNKFDKFDNLKIGTTTSGVGSEDRFLGIFFTSDKNAYQGFNIKGFQYPSILNLKNPINGGINYNNLPDLKTEEDFKNYQKQLIKNNYDGIEYGKSFLDFEEGGYQNPILEAIVFEPEQIHILGSKQDIEGFKNFIKNKNELKSPIPKNTEVLNLWVENKNQILEKYPNLKEEDFLSLSQKEAEKLINCL